MWYRLRLWLIRRAAEGKIYWRLAWPMGRPYARESIRLYSDGGGIGDELMCTAIFREIRRVNPRCRITFISRHPSVFQTNPNLHAVEPYSIEAIRGATQLTYGPKLPPPRPLMTMMAECVGLKLQTDQLDPPEVLPRPVLAKEISSLAKPLIVIQPQGSHWTPNKQWPIESWAELIRKLATEFEIVEVGKESLFAGQDFGARFHSFTGTTTIEEFGWIVSQASVFVGPSSGGMHFANAFQVPSVIIFGGYESPEGYQYPRTRAFFSAVPCAQCWLTTPCPYDRKCLSTIRAEDVYDAVRSAAREAQSAVK
jgi:ADP-heptose:LPS heptosyltransferase